MSKREQLPASIRSAITQTGVKIPANVDMHQIAMMMQRGEIDLSGQCLQFDQGELQGHSYAISVQAGMHAPGPGVKPDYRFKPGSAMDYMQKQMRKNRGIEPGSPTDKAVKAISKKV